VKQRTRAWIERRDDRWEERRACLVVEGPDSPRYAKVDRRSSLRYLVSALTLVALAVAVPERFELIAALVVLPAFMLILRRGSFHAATSASDYYDGWLAGRLALVNRLSEQLPHGSEAVIQALLLENQRDLEVLLDVRTETAPDDLSELDDL
jgi:hypothetical protein